MKRLTVRLVSRNTTPARRSGLVEVGACGGYRLIFADKNPSGDMCLLPELQLTSRVEDVVELLATFAYLDRTYTSICIEALADAMNLPPPPRYHGSPAVLFDDWDWAAEVIADMVARCEWSL